MPSGFDSAWCRLSPVRVTPNEAVPLPAWAGQVTRPGSLPSGQIDRHPGGQICSIPDGGHLQLSLACPRSKLPNAVPMSRPAPNPVTAVAW